MTALLPSQVLDAAADLIEPEGRWTQHEWARDAKGLSCRPHAEYATCWCAAGAVERAGGRLTDVGRFWKAATDTWFGPFNDNHTQAEVVTALRKAADLARSEGQ